MAHGQLLEVKARRRCVPVTRRPDWARRRPGRPTNAVPLRRRPRFPGWRPFAATELRNEWGSSIVRAWTGLARAPYGCSESVLSIRGPSHRSRGGGPAVMPTSSSMGHASRPVSAVPQRSGLQGGRRAHGSSRRPPVAHRAPGPTTLSLRQRTPAIPRPDQPQEQHQVAPLVEADPRGQPSMSARLRGQDRDHHRERERQTPTTAVAQPHRAPRMPPKNSVAAVRRGVEAGPPGCGGW
jgi:hypothetical protein